MQINQSTLAALYKGYRTLFFAALHSADPKWSMFAMKTPSAAASEIYHWLGAVPGMRKLLGEVVIKNLVASNYTITNDEYEDTIAVKQADIERDTYGIYNPLFQAMGQAAAEHPDELLATLLIAGFTATDYTGDTFFADVHKHRVGSALNTFDNKMTEKFSANGYIAARKKMRSILNEEGRPMNLGRKLLLIVSPTYESTALQVLNAELVGQLNADGSAIAAVSNVQKGTAELLVWSRLAADEHKWFLMDVGQPVKPVIFQEEKAVALTSLTAPDADHVLKKHEFLYQGYGRYSVGYGLPQLIVGSTGADAAL